MNELKIVAEEIQVGDILRTSEGDRVITKVVLCGPHKEAGGVVALVARSNEYLPGWDCWSGSRYYYEVVTVLRSPATVKIEVELTTDEVEALKSQSNHRGLVAAYDKLHRAALLA